MKENESIVKVYSVENKVQADMLVEYLQNQGIPAYSQAEGPGGILDIYGTNTVFGENIFVRSEDETKARECIQNLEEQAEERG